MKKIIIILLIYSTGTSYGQIIQDTVHYFSKLYPENGFFIRPDSLPDGKWIAFCEANTNQIGLELHYKNGKRNGESISFWSNGEIQQSGYYKDGCLVGKNEKWYRNGIKKSESFCDVIDFEKQSSHCNLINYWSKDGKQLIINGTGKYISYHNNDTLQVVGEYYNSLQTGKWTWYNDNGTLLYIENFSQGKKEGEYIFYYRNGQIRDRGLYSNGKQVGKWESWYRDGKNETCEFRVDGKRDGQYKSWHPNGQLSELGNYKLGEKDSTWKYWNENGKLETKEKYLNGKLIKTKNYR